MEKFIRFIITINGSIILTIILFVLGLIIATIVNIVAALVGIDIQSPQFIIILNILVFMFVALPYALIVTYTLYSSLSKLQTKSYGLLAGAFTQGACCWIFNTLTLPYFLISLKFPPKYDVIEALPKNYKRNFIIGWVFGLVLTLILSVIMVLLTLIIKP